MPLNKFNKLDLITLFIYFLTIFSLCKILIQPLPNRQELWADYIWKIFRILKTYYIWLNFLVKIDTSGKSSISINVMYLNKYMY